MGSRRKPLAKRKPCGRLAQDDTPSITTADWKRAKDLAKRLAGDARLGTEIGRLNHLRILTDTQAAAGQRIAEVYGRYDRAMGRRRSAASPGYQIGLLRGGEDPGECEALPEMKANCRCPACLAAEDDYARTRAYKKLMDALGPLGLRTIALIERLCIDDEHLLPDQLDAVRAGLDVAAAHFGLMGRGGRRPKREIALSRNHPPKSCVSDEVKRLPHPIDGALATLVPDADAAAKAELRASMMAFVDRWKIEARKLRS